MLQATYDKHDSHLHKSLCHVAELKAVNGVYKPSSLTIIKRGIAVIRTFLDYACNLLSCK